MSLQDHLVLYVDDERPNRIVFEQSFRTRFRVRAVSSGAEALEVLKGDSVAVMVTDQRMPEMTGHELLIRVKTLYPEIVRIVITAYSDLDPILRAVNEGLVARYMIKPWDRAELEQLLTWSIEKFEEQKESAALQLRLMQTERLVTVGSIGAAVAHDLQRPLAVMLQNIQRLTEHGELSATLHALIERAPWLSTTDREHLRDLASELPELARDLGQGARLMDDLMTSLRQFIKPDRTAKENRATDPMPVLRYAISVCQDTAVKAQGKIFYDGPATLPKVSVGSTELTQVLINLLSNAAQALLRKSPPSGHVIASAADAGACVRFTVTDDGPGMPESVLKKIGTPFFSTRPDGTGLGMAQCRRLVSGAGGELNIDSREGHGTTVHFTIPKA